MRRSNQRTHFAAAILYSGLAVFASLLPLPAHLTSWRTFSNLSLVAAIVAWLAYFKALRRAYAERLPDSDDDEQQPLPKAQARMIDNGRLPVRRNPRIELQPYETCHFNIMARRMVFAPPDGLGLAEASHLAIRFSGGSFYYIVQPQSILLPALLTDEIRGELVITNYRLIFLAGEYSFDVPLPSLSLLDCSAHLIDFQVRDSRFTLQTEAACYAEKVLDLLLPSFE